MKINEIHKKMMKIHENQGVHGSQQNITEIFKIQWRSMLINMKRFSYILQSIRQFIEFWRSAAEAAACKLSFKYSSFGNDYYLTNNGCGWVSFDVQYAHAGICHESTPYQPAYASTEVPRRPEIPRCRLCRSLARAIVGWQSLKIYIYIHIDVNRTQLIHTFIHTCIHTYLPA